MSEKRENSGTLGKNERKEKETHPSHTGSATIAGVDYWVSAWVKEGARGKFFSLSFKAKEPRQEKRELPPIDEDLNDDVPF
jgi:hypothetical protein